MKFAICNELWPDRPIEEVIEIAAKLGYDGLEIAPFTLAEDVEEIPASRRQEIARIAEASGIGLIGLHWLFASPKGLHLTTADPEIRRRSSDYLKSLACLCGQLGGSVMVFGSPKQRNLEPGTTPDQALERAREVFATVAPSCEKYDVTLCIEGLSPLETDFIQTASQAAELADSIGHAHIDIMLDVKAMATMPEGVEGTIRRYGERARHFHANEPDGRGPGVNENREIAIGRWSTILKTLQDSGYQGWVSCEPFSAEPDATTVARTALEILTAAQERITP